MKLTAKTCKNPACRTVTLQAPAIDVGEAGEEWAVAEYGGACPTCQGTEFDLADVELEEKAR